MLKLRSENGIDILIKEVEKRGRVLETLGPDASNSKNKVAKIGAEIYHSIDLDTRKIEILSEKILF